MSEMALPRPGPVLASQIRYQLTLLMRNPRAIAAGLILPGALLALERGSAQHLTMAQAAPKIAGLVALSAIAIALLHPRERAGRGQRGRRAAPLARLTPPGVGLLRRADRSHHAGHCGGRTDPRPGGGGDDRGAPDRARGPRPARRRPARRAGPGRGRDRDHGRHPQRAVSPARAHADLHPADRAVRGVRGYREPAALGEHRDDLPAGPAAVDAASRALIDSSGTIMSVHDRGGPTGWGPWAACSSRSGASGGTRTGRSPRPAEARTTARWV